MAHIALHPYRSEEVFPRLFSLAPVPLNATVCEILWTHSPGAIFVAITATIQRYPSVDLLVLRNGDGVPNPALAITNKALALLIWSQAAPGRPCDEQ